MKNTSEKITYHKFLKTLKSCPFCAKANRIIKQRPSAYLTYALAPYHKHHLLIIPNRHVILIEKLSTKETADIKKLQNLGIELLKKLGYKSSTVLVRQGDEGGRSIKHLHYHIIPHVRIGDLDHRGHMRKTLNENEVNKIMLEFTEILKRKRV